MPRTNPEKKLFMQIKAVGKVTANNLQPWFIKSANTYKGSVQWPRKLLRRLEEQGFVQQIPLYPHIKREQLTFKDMYFVPVGSPIKEQSRRYAEHDSMISDILLAFVNLYPDFTFRIKREPLFELKRRTKNNKKYNPDAVIKMFSPEGKEYNFIVEGEKSKQPGEIIDLKIKEKCENLYPFKHYGLSPNTSILFVYMMENYSVLDRPIDFKEISGQVGSVNRSLQTLVGLSKGLSSKYRFMSFYNFPKLNQKVWFKTDGKRCKLI